MRAKDLSILIPARNEEFLARTIQDLLENTSEQSEIIVVLDGAWASPPIPQHPRVNVVFLPVSIGQRSATNLACRLSKAKYVCKVDAHCSFDKGFDRKMLDAFKETGDNVVMCPVMRNLHVFDWICKCGFTHYQDKGDTCPECGKKMEKKMIWEPRRGTRNYSYCFDATPHFQYNSAYRNTEAFKEGAKVGLTESMSLQGSFFMMSRDKYWELNIGDEKFGSWGSQGIQVACSFWLTGGRVVINHKSWYAHCFRTKASNGFGFPYQLSGRQVDHAKKYAGELFFENKFPNQTRSLSWLIEKFSPVPGWSEEELTRIKRFDLPS